MKKMEKNLVHSIFKNWTKQFLSLYLYINTTEREWRMMTNTMNSLMNMGISSDQ